MSTRARPGGFTLLEAMVVLSIVGVLSSIAIPQLRNLQLRSRKAERGMILQAVCSSVEDYYMRQGHFPQLVDPTRPQDGSNLTLAGNPSWAPPGSTKRPWRVAPLGGDHWQSLSLHVEGAVYYRYWGTGNEPAGGAQHQYWLIADGDLDGDGVLDQVQRFYSYQGIRLQHIAGSPNPAATWEWRFPGDESTF